MTSVFTLAGGLRVLISPASDVWLTNGETYSQLVYLGAEDSPENWREATSAEREAAAND